VQDTAGAIELLSDDLREAVEERAGIMEHDGHLPRPEAEALALRDTIERAVSACLGRFLLAAACPHVEECSRAVQWLDSRAIDAALVAALGVRWCTPESFEHGVVQVRAEYPPEVMDASGIKRLWTFAKRDVSVLLVPYIEHGAVVGIKGRPILAKAEVVSLGVPRFVALGRVELYMVEHALAQPGPILLTEGESDTWAAWSCGWPAVGVPGASAFVTAWAARFRGREVLLAFDGDGGGRTGAAKVREAFEAAGLPRPRRLALPDGLDLNDWLRRQSPAPRDGAQPRGTERGSHGTAINW
jgi:DNA primase